MLPVHLGMHWCLAVIDLKSHKFLYYDSLLGTNPACLSRLRYGAIFLSPALYKLLCCRNYLKSESVDKRKMQLDLSDWHDSTPQKIPSQRNGSDCGVFTCMVSFLVAVHFFFHIFLVDLLGSMPDTKLGSCPLISHRYTLSSLHTSSVQ